jgi:hypothetical protein
MLSPQPSERKKMIELALKEKAPKTYLQLRMQGKLEEFLQNHDEAMMESYDPIGVASEVMDQIPEDEYQRKIQEGYTAVARHDEETLATWLDFKDPPD